MNRRVFVKSGALALVTMGLSPTFLKRTVFAQALPKTSKGKVLICLFQRGAADGLNVVVPHGEEIYLLIDLENVLTGAEKSELRDADLTAGVAEVR